MYVKYYTLNATDAAVKSIEDLAELRRTLDAEAHIGCRQNYWILKSAEEMNYNYKITITIL